MIKVFLKSFEESLMLLVLLSGETWVIFVLAAFHHFDESLGNLLLFSVVVFNLCVL